MLILTMGLAVAARLDVVSHLPPGLDAIHRDAAGEPLLHAGDPYYHLRQSRALLERGHTGTRRIDGAPWDDASFAPTGRPVRSNLLHPLQAGLARLVGPRLSLQQVAYFLPLLLSALAAGLLFSVGRRLAEPGLAVATAAATLGALHPEWISHTHAGVADTTALSMLLLCLSVALILQTGERLSEPRRALPWLVALALVLWLFRMTWFGYLAAVGLAVVYLGGRLLLAPAPTRRSLRGFFANRRGGLLALVIALIALGPVLLSRTGQKFQRYAGLSLDDRFPFGTDQVQELLGLAPLELIARLGWAPFGLALAGLLLGLFRPAKGSPTGNGGSERGAILLLGLWLLPAAAAGALAMRFLVLAVPPVALLAAYGLHRLSSWIPRFRGLAYGLAIIALAASFLPRLEGFRDRRPIADRAVVATAQAIAEQSPPGALINVWWDHGYLYAALAERPVIFDGGSFQTPRLYWMSRALTARQESYGLNLLRLIDCGRENQVWQILRRHADADRAVAVLQQSLRQRATRQVWQHLRGHAVPEASAQEILRHLACEPPPAWLVVSSDLLAKTTSWGRFGTWSFADGELEPSPGLITADVPCQLLGSQLECRNGYRANLQTDGFADRSSPGHFAMRGPVRLDGLVPMVYQQGRGLRMTFAHRDLADSLFSRLYFFNGRDLEHFELAHEEVIESTGKRILAYRIRW
ncbi:MAG: STT3 domain-containing protein [Acidobacteriota bacterium]